MTPDQLNSRVTRHRARGLQPQFWTRSKRVGRFSGKSRDLREISNAATVVRRALITEITMNNKTCNEDRILR